MIAKVIKLKKGKINNRVTRIQQINKLKTLLFETKHVIFDMTNKGKHHKHKWEHDTIKDKVEIKRGNNLHKHFNPRSYKPDSRRNESLHSSGKPQKH